MESNFGFGDGVEANAEYKVELHKQLCCVNSLQNLVGPCMQVFVGFGQALLWALSACQVCLASIKLLNTQLAPAGKCFNHLHCAVHIVACSGEGTRGTGRRKVVDTCIIEGSTSDQQQQSRFLRSNSCHQIFAPTVAVSKQ